MRFYTTLSRCSGLTYPAKILLVTFLGIQVPLITVVVVALVFSVADWNTVLQILAILLAATLVGTACTLFVIHDLLTPIVAASRAMREYRQNGQLPKLPLDHDDEAGMLMRDTDSTVRELDALVQRLAEFDTESGLANRSRLRRLIDDQLAARKRIAVVSMLVENRPEIDYFFDVDTGKAMLAEFIDRLAAEPSILELGRVAPGVFKFSTPLKDRDTLEQSLAELSRRMSEPLISGPQMFYPRLVVGVALSPEDGTRADTLMTAAMTATKSAGQDAGSPVNFYSAEMERSARWLFQLDQEIRTAIDAGQFELHYQPIVDFTRKKVVYAEALVRWNHPVHGMISPADFIPVAETSGLIVPLGAWIMETACRQAADWSDALIDVPRIAINISARQFRDPDLLGMIDRSVEAAGIGFDRLKLEITETVLFTDIHQAKQTIAELQARGILVALDDFGADYSNLRYVANFDFDEIKLDRLFVHYADQDARLRAICSSIIALCEGLNTSLVAEGVERPEEIELLYRLGCRLFQGYFFSRPVGAMAIPDTVRRIVTDLADPDFAATTGMRSRSDAAPE